MSMPGPFFHYTHADDESDRSLFSSAGTESKRGYRALERTSCPHPVYQASHTASSVCPELRRNILPPNNWPGHPPIPTHRSAAATQPDSSPFLLPPTLRAAPIPSYNSNSPPPHYSYGARFCAHPLVLQPNPRTVATVIPVGHAQYDGTLIDAHTYHNDPSFGFPQADYTVECPRAVPSPFVAMPTVPTSLGTGASSHMDLAFPSDPTFGLSPRHPITTFQHLTLSDSAPIPSLPGSFHSESYSYPSPSLSTDNHTLVLPSETPDKTQPQQIVTTPVGQPFTFTVPLEVVEFPPILGSGEAPFFQCRWADCGIWISSEKEAVKNHLARVHNVVLKGRVADSVCCEWVGCSSSLQKNGLVRHFQTHLGLKWLCSVCKGAYTRQDSVRFHARREPGCQLAWAISHPSVAAYSVRINGDNTATLTKILQPKDMARE